MYRQMYRKFKKKLVHRLLAKPHPPNLVNTIFNQYIDVVMVTNLYDFSFNMMEVEFDFFNTENNIFFEAYIPYVCAYSIEGMVTKMPRFMLEVPRPCTIFCFAFAHYARVT